MHRRTLPLAAAALLAAGAPACKHDNPPTTREIQWADPATAARARQSCYDCHSNETHWAWTSYTPLVGNLIVSDVHRGRAAMNFSEWDRPQDDAEEAPEKVREGEMPLKLYLLAHADARMSDAERAAFAAGLARTFAADPPRGGGDDREDDGKDDDGDNDGDEARDREEDAREEAEERAEDAREGRDDD